MAWDQPYYDYPAKPSLGGLAGLAWRHWPGYWVRLADDIAAKRHRRMWKHKIRKGRRGAAFVMSKPARGLRARDVVCGGAK